MKSLSRRSPIVRTALLFSLMLLDGCGEDVPSGPSGNGELALATVPRQPDEECPDTSVTYFVDLSEYVRDVSATALVAQMVAGEEKRVAVLGTGCGWSVGGQEWASTNPSAVSVNQNTGFAAFTATVRARSQGEAQIYVDFTAHDGKRYRTTLAYCAVRYDATGYCPKSRKIDLVRVVAP